MATRSDVPGLISIEEHTKLDGTVQFIFEIEDERVDEFYAAFGLETGDSAGFQRVLIEAITLLTERMRDA